MSNVIDYQFSPVPLNLKTAMRRIFKGNQYKVIDAIADETYLYPDTRLTLTKELASRYLANKTGIAQPHVVAALNKLEKKDCISMVKSHVKGEGSIISLRINVILSLSESDTKNVSNKSETKNVSNFKQSDTENVSNQAKLDTDSVSNQKSISKKDHQESDQTDSTINIDQKEKKQSEKNNIETSFNCSSLVKNKVINSKESNSNTPDINLLCPAGAAGKGEFSALGNILPDIKSASSTAVTSPAPVENTPETSGFSISPEIIAEGYKVLSSKGFSKEQIQTVTQNITDRIRKYNPIRPDRYFLTSVNNEKVKNVSPFSKQTAADAFYNPVSVQCAVPSVEKTRELVNEFWKEEKDSITTEEILTTLTKTCPDKLSAVVTNVNNDKKIQKGLSFMIEGEAKKIALENIILTEFKKTYPEIVI
ncbi:MAG: hypothetical protein ABRQ37_16440 [Candidatus Eremiobacterota bacterium]